MVCVRLRISTYMEMHVYANVMCDAVLVEPKLNYFEAFAFVINGRVRVESDVGISM